VEIILRNAVRSVILCSLISLCHCLSWGKFWEASSAASDASGVQPTIRNWPDTGQTACYDTTTAIGCTGSGGAYPRQDADFANTPAPRSYSGPTAHAVYTSDFTTTDNTTGLIWKSCIEGLSGAACVTGTANTYTWAVAQTQCTALNSANSNAGYAGQKNWRLPTKPELETIVDASTQNPAISAVAFPATINNNYLTLNEYLPNTANAWMVNFGTGMSVNLSKTGSNYVRCVAAGTPVTNTLFQDNGNGTVTELRTNLVWQRCTDGLTGATCTGASNVHTWTQALTFCNTLGLASRTWRLPSLNELRSIIAADRQSPAIDAVVFPGTVSNYYWSSTTHIPNVTEGWMIFFTEGSSANIIKTNTGRVRCVSTGP
jgi:hypothetical protein